MNESKLKILIFYMSYYSLAFPKFILLEKCQQLNWIAIFCEIFSLLTIKSIVFRTFSKYNILRIWNILLEADASFGNRCR